jgi:hypothetical protein
MTLELPVTTEVITALEMIEPPKKQYLREVVNKSAIADFHHNKDGSLLLPKAFELHAS